MNVIKSRRAVAGWRGQSANRCGGACSGVGSFQL